MRNARYAINADDTGVLFQLTFVLIFNALSRCGWTSRRLCLAWMASLSLCFTTGIGLIYVYTMPLSHEFLCLYKAQSVWICVF